LRDTTLSVAAWNVWCHFGEWEARFARIGAVLADAGPDLIALVETWRTDEHDPVDDIAGALDYHVARAESWFAPFEIDSGSVILSRWPILSSESERTTDVDGQPGALIQHALIAGPRGEIDMYAVMLDWRPDRSDIRQSQVRALAEYVQSRSDFARATIVCGDFNAAPESDEMRSLTGQATTAAPGLLLYDAWSIAGTGPGITWSNANPFAASALLPDRRIDYVLSAWPRANGVGHPLGCALLGDGDDPPASDHYGVVVELRY
jgi:endonuclease/exonuclease/phosphatase family metal-dependent hydrolase